MPHTAYLSSADSLAVLPAALSTPPLTLWRLLAPYMVSDAHSAAILLALSASPALYELQVAKPARSTWGDL